jgi:hypothetical protein
MLVEIAKDMGFRLVLSVGGKRSVMCTLGKADYGVPLGIGTTFQTLTETLLERIPELEDGVRFLIRHEQGHIKLKHISLLDGLYVFLAHHFGGSLRIRYIFRESQSYLYAACKSENPIGNISSSLVVLQNFYNHVSKIKYPMEQFARGYLDLYFPWLNENAKELAIKKSKTFEQKIV